MIDLGYWEHEDNQLLTVDRYFDDNKILKEALKIDKRTHKLLKKCCLKRNKVTLNKLEKDYYQVINSYKMNIFNGKICQWKANRIDSWKFESTIPSNLFDKLFKALLKEKLKLNNTTREILDWISDTKPPLVTFQLLENIQERNKNIEKFKLDRHCILESKNTKNNLFMIVGKKMPSYIENNLRGLLEESITYGTYDDYYSNDKRTSKLYPIFLESKLKLDKYKIFKVYPIEISHKAISKPKKTFWEPANTLLPNVEKLCERIWLEIYDIDFNKLELFKFNMNDINQTKNDKYKEMYQKCKKVWKLSKESLKELEWNPIKKYLKDNENVKNILCDDINQKEYTVLKYSLNLRKLHCNLLDLIDIDKKTFGSLKLVMNSATEKKISVYPVINDSLVLENLTVSTVNNDATFPININTSLLPQKRSFIDDELRSILESKKNRQSNKKENQDIQNKNCNRLLTKLLDIGTKENVLLPERRQTEDVESNQEDFNLSLPLKSLINYNITEKCIVLNTNKLSQNHILIQCLRERENVNVIEREFPHDFDFILNESICVIRINLENFFQIRQNGRLHYENLLTDLKLEFKLIIILVEYSEILEQTDKDVFWKIQLFLKCSQYRPILVPNKADRLFKEMTRLISTFSHSYKNVDFTEITVEEKILLSLNLNILLIKSILKRITLPEFLILIQIEDSNEILESLTAMQLNRIKTLLMLSW